MTALLNDLERNSTSTGLQALSPAQLIASLKAANALLTLWQALADPLGQLPVRRAGLTAKCSNTGRKSDEGARNERERSAASVLDAMPS